MLNFLPAPLRGAIALLLITLNIIFWPVVLYILFVLNFIPIKKWQQICSRWMHKVPFLWTQFNELIEKLTVKINWQIHGVEDLKYADWYLLISNHQSWADIFILQKIFYRKIPLLKFFMKKQLLWSLPFAGWACWILDFPFMERYSKEFLTKNPQFKGKDLETTRKACEKFKTVPTSVISFVEGTRFTEEKHQKQSSPYKHLLRPRAGGVAYTMSAMGDCFHKILNVTIIYQDGKPDLWKFICGQLPNIVVNVETLPVTKDLLGDYESDRQYRAHFQNWLNELWQQKDELMEQVLTKKVQDDVVPNEELIKGS